MKVLRTVIKILLFPFSLIYGTVVWIRNKLYDYQLFKSTSFNIPIISVGNLAVGGTGKTPHVEYLIWLFNKHKIKTAVLSRGYKRETKGFLWVENHSDAQEVGDEPMQIKTKFSTISVVVDENRTHGIQKIITENEQHKIGAIILDDAYQHRRVIPELSILLLDYNQLQKGDFLLPMGCLREPLHQNKRADIIVITKCPGNLPKVEQQKLKEKIGKPTDVFFTSIHYENFRSISQPNITIPKPSFILLITGIANPKPLINYLIKMNINVKSLTYSDHYNFKRKDIEKIKNIYSKITEKNKIILTTEKDYQRLKNENLKKVISPIRGCIFYIPITIEFLNNENCIFDKKILNIINN